MADLLLYLMEMKGLMNMIVNEEKITDIVEEGKIGLTVHNI